MAIGDFDNNRTVFSIFLFLHSKKNYFNIFSFVSMYFPRWV